MVTNSLQGLQIIKNITAGFLWRMSLCLVSIIENGDGDKGVFLGRSQRNLIYIPSSSHVEKEKGNPPAPTLWCTTSETM